jgi:hypothetical protein
MAVGDGPGGRGGSVSDAKGALGRKPSELLRGGPSGRQALLSGSVSVGADVG